MTKQKKRRELEEMKARLLKMDKLIEDVLSGRNNSSVEDRSRCPYCSDEELVERM